MNHIFEEIRITPNNFVKISKGKYTNYYGIIKDFPIGMLVGKDNEEINSELCNNCVPNYYTKNNEGFFWVSKKITKRTFRKKGVCNLRHLEELPGLIPVQILFDGESPNSMLEEPINISLPVCFLIPLEPKEQIKFKQQKEKEEACQIIEGVYKKCKEYEKFIKNDSLLEERKLDEIKNILADVEKINCGDLEKKASDEFKDKLEFIKEIKNQINLLLIQKIRNLEFKEK